MELFPHHIELIQWAAWPLFVLLLGMGWWPCCCSAGDCGGCNDSTATMHIEFTGAADADCTNCNDFNTTTFVADFNGDSGTTCTWEDTTSIPCGSGDCSSPIVKISSNLNYAAFSLTKIVFVRYSVGVDAQFEQADTIATPTTCTDSSIALQSGSEVCCDWSSATASIAFA